MDTIKNRFILVDGNKKRVGEIKVYEESCQIQYDMGEEIEFLDSEKLYQHLAEKLVTFYMVNPEYFEKNKDSSDFLTPENAPVENTD